MRALFSGLIILLPQAVTACSVCMGGGATPEQQRGYFWGIFMLLCLPFILFSTIGGMILLSIRRKAQVFPTGSHAS